MGRKRPRSTRFALRDYDRLEQMLASRPDQVLKRLRETQVRCLDEIDAYCRLCRDRPAVAARVRFVAATMGIPEKGNMR